MNYFISLKSCFGYTGHMKQMSSEMHTRIFNKLVKAKAKMRGSYQEKKLKCADKYIINVHNVIAEVLNQH